MTIKGFFFKIGRYLTLKIILILIIMAHIILFFIVNMYGLSYMLPDFYVKIFKLMKYGVVELWPILVSVKEHLHRTVEDPMVIIVTLLFPTLYIPLAFHLLCVYIIDWFIFIFYYWGYLCYKVLNVFFSWIPDFHIQIFNFHWAFYVLIFSTLYLLIAIYLLGIDRDFTIYTRTLLKYIVIWLVILIAISIWILVIITQIVGIQDITLWKGLQTILYFIIVNKLVVKIIKSKTKSIKK